MKRLLSVLLVCSLCFSLCDCGSEFFISGAINTANVSGLVSLVQFTSVSNNGTVFTITVVTFLQSSLSNTINFCGDQRTQFPMNQFVNASFTPGPVCATVVQIVIVV